MRTQKINGQELIDYSIWENARYHEQYIICPYCDYEDPDSWELESEFDDEYECAHCGKIFEVSQNIEITYTSKKRFEDYPEKEELCLR